MKDDCAKYKKQLENEGNLTPFVYYEYNIIDINDNIWWINPGSTIHISNTLQGL